MQGGVETQITASEIAGVSPLPAYRMMAVNFTAAMYQLTGVYGDYRENFGALYVRMRV